MKVEEQRPWTAVALAARAAQRVQELFTVLDTHVASEHQTAIDQAVALARQGALKGQLDKTAALKAYTQALIASAAARACFTAVGLLTSRGAARVALTAAFAVEAAFDAAIIDDLAADGQDVSEARQNLAATAVNVTLSAQDAARALLGEDGRKVLARATLADFKWLRTQSAELAELEGAFFVRPLWPDGQPSGLNGNQRPG